MNLHRFLLVGAAVAAVAGCSNDDTSPRLVTPPPSALLHIINAVPDTGAMDFRFIDVVDGVPNVEFTNLAFRDGTTIGYQPVSVGSHHLRVFMSSATSNFDPAYVSQIMADTTFTFAEGVHYTFVFYGKARPATGQTRGTQKFLILTDNFTVPTTWSVRVVNVDSVARDFYVQTVANTSSPVAVSTPSTTVAGAPTFAAVAPLTASAYTSLALASSTQGHTISATPAGATTPVWSAGIYPGSAAVLEVAGVSGALAALPGTRIAGSIFTGILFPVSTPGSKAPSFTTPGVVIMADRFF